MDNLLQLFLGVFSLEIMLIMLVSILVGILLGAIPGLGSTIGMALMLPITFYMKPLPGLIILLSIYTGGIWGGAISAILINLPGAPPAIATTFDGYPMAVSGRGSYALGLSLGASMAGGILGIIALILCLNPLAAVALKFGPVEFLVVILMGTTAVASLSRESFWKGLFVGVVGLMTGTVGFSTSEVLRGTFGLMALYDGIPFIPVMIGLFAVTEMLVILEGERLTLADIATKETGQSFSQLLEGLIGALRYPFVIIKSSLVGLFLGLLPGAGATAGALLAYDNCKRFSKDPDKFGKGCPEGIIAAESGNNATEGGSLATALALGVPGSSATAMILAAITLQGIQIGPHLLKMNRDLVYMVLISELLQLFVMLLLGVFVAYYMTAILYISVKSFIPLVIILSVIGTYALQSLYYYPQLVLISGVVGWLMRKGGFPVGPLAVGIVLAPMLESYHTFVVQGYPQGTLYAIFTNPFATTIFIVFLVVSVAPYIKYLSNLGRFINKKK